MKKCFKCLYFYPNDSFDSHFSVCQSSESRIQCPICNCDYSRAEANEHTLKCKGDEDTISFISEYSCKQYSQNTIKKLLQILKEAYGSELNGRQVLRTINDKDFNINNWITFEDERHMECPICLSDVPINDIFVLSCVDNHKVCYECLLQHSLLKLEQNAALTCPSGNCNEIIHINELRSLPFPPHIVKKLVEKYERQLFNVFVQNTNGAIRCPNGECNWVGMVDVKDRLNIKCGRCGTQFCTICRGKSHYRVECNEIPVLMQQWMTWCNVGRDALQREKEKLNQDFEKYNQAKADNEKRNEELKRNFEQLQQDEGYKEANCRKCPGCSRIVQKLAGCDLMVCGVNYHGGDQQNGCGQRFNWNNAQPYVSQLQNQPELEKLALDAPKKAGNFQHYPYKCDGCSVDIIGIRFECIYCGSVNFCENCEGEQTLNHPNGHIFKLIME
jgi:hypothetical protein